MDTHVSSVAVADVNHDGHQDIIVGNDYTFFNHLLIGDSTGNFTAEELPGEFSTFNIAVADVNGDSFFDIILGNGYAYGIKALINTDNGTFTVVEYLPGDDNTPSIIAVFPQD